MAAVTVSASNMFINGLIQLSHSELSLSLLLSICLSLRLVNTFLRVSEVQSHTCF